jgi:hypothetical protein
MGSSNASELTEPNSPGKLRQGFLAFVLHPALIGVLVVVALNSLTLTFALRNDQYEGADVAGVRRFLSGEYRAEVLRVLGLTSAISTIVGLVLGLVVSATIRLRQAWLRSTAIRGGALAMRAIVGIFAMYLTVWIDDIVARPALYQDILLAKGGLRASVQILLTDHLQRGWLWTFAAVALLGWFVVPALKRSGSRLNWRPVTVAFALIATFFVLIHIPWRRAWTSRLTKQKDERLNVLVIAADSLRPDRITPTIAPHLTKLARQGVVFSKAYTPLARTFPAWVSLMTGQFPHHHGVRNMFPRWETRAKDFQAMPSSFSKAGYYTGVVSDFAGDIFRRIDLGFQRLDTPTFTMRELLLERVLQQDVALLPWLRGPVARWAIPALREMHVASDAQTLTEDALTAIDESGKQPFFVTVFYSTTHFPYAAPAPFYRKFKSPNYHGRFQYAKADTLLAESTLSTDDVQQIRGLFDGAAAAVDVAVGNLLDGLASRDLIDRTLIVVTADHGETLYEYNRGQGHGDHLFGNENLRVPLIVVKPGSGHAEIPIDVSLIDLAPTLCELARVACGKDMDGRSLGAALQGRVPDARPVFAETGLWFTETLPEVPSDQRIPYPDLIHLTEVDRNHADEIVIRREWESYTTAVKHRMVREGRFKLIYMPTRRGPKFELFDAYSDLGETSDVALKYPEVVQRLKSILMQWTLADVSMESRGDVVLPRLQTGDAGGGQ